jgi:hypothetical protein
MKLNEPRDPPQPRRLKIEQTGDFFRGKVVPKIRLTGRWLDQAGFKAGDRAQVEFAHQSSVPGNPAIEPLLTRDTPRLRPAPLPKMKTKTWAYRLV